MEVNEVQGALGHPLSSSAQGTPALRSWEKSNQKQDRKGSQENVGADPWTRGQEESSQPSGDGIPSSGGKAPAPLTGRKKSLSLGEPEDTPACSNLVL